MKDLSYSLLALVMLCVGLSGQDFWPTPTSDLVALESTDAGYLTTWGDGTVVLVANDMSGYSQGDTGRVQGPVGGGELPTLVTSWKDKKGVTHTVQTPIPSTTPAGLGKAIELHDSLVSELQRRHPPMPVPVVP